MVATSKDAGPLLEVRGLNVRFAVRTAAGKRAKLDAVRDVSFAVHAGETVGLVGESGCGKTSVARAIVRLLKPASGGILFRGEEITGLKGAALMQYRREAQMVFQDPLNSLDPRLSVGDIISEALDIHELAGTRDDRRRKVEEMLGLVGLNAAHANHFAHELSGGQRQRVGIARALAVEPKLLVCDEPVSALDVSVQAQIVNLLQDLQEQRGVAYLFIAHDLAVVRHISRRILVMYLGRIVESGPAEELIANPRHPYTAGLIASVPQIKRTGTLSAEVKGDLPSPLRPPPGCPFHTRCPRAEFPRCGAEFPIFRAVGPGRAAACHFA